MNGAMMIDLTDYYSGGYFLIKANKPDWTQLQTPLLPEKLVSLSNCMCPKLGAHWGWIPGNPEAALKFGIPENKLSEFLEWCVTEYKADMDFWCMFYSPDSARRFVERFLPDRSDLFLIGAGLHKSLEATNLREPPTSEPYPIERRIEQHLPLDEGGTVLGFEVISFSYGDFACSWLCSCLHEEMYNLYGIRPGQYGLLETQESARQIYQWITENKHRAEPEPYDYWLLISYPI